MIALASGLRVYLACGVTDMMRWTPLVASVTVASGRQMRRIMMNVAVLG